jgi:fructose-specific phosphotransferase system IIC component
MTTFFAGDVLDAADLEGPPWGLGMVAYGSRPIASGVAGPVTPSGAAVQGVLRLDNITMTAGRRYLVMSSPLRMALATATDRGKFELRYNATGTATTSSAAISRSEIAVPTGGFTNDSFPPMRKVITPGSSTALASVLLCMSRPTGTGAITAYGSTDDEQLWIAVIDQGLAVADGGVTIL